MVMAAARMNSTNFNNLGIAAIIGFSMIVGGCGGNGQTRRHREASTKLPAVQAQLNIGMPFDADGNGYPDTMQALVYLFPDSRFSSIPVRAVGTFDFLMHSESGELMAQWVFPPEIVEQAARNLPAGPGYSMYLRLAPGKDVMSPNAADIRVRFLNEAGEEIRSTGRATVRLGG
jgi:hypothetical protein